MNPVHNPSRIGPRDMRLAIVIALRELRAGLKGFRILMACLVLGVAAIATVGSVSKAVQTGLAEDATLLLGGDVDLRLLQRPATEKQRAWLMGHSHQAQSPRQLPATEKTHVFSF